MDRTTINVSDELADELYDRKERGDSYDDAIRRLIEAQDLSEDLVAELDGRKEQETESIEDVIWRLIDEAD